MAIDLRLLIAIVIFCILIIGLFLCLSGDSEKVMAGKDIQTEAQTKNILSDAAELLESGTPSNNTNNSPPSNNNYPSDIATPENPYIPRVTSTKLTMPYYSTLDSHNIADTIDDDVSSIQSEPARETDEYFDRPYSRRVSSIIGEEQTSSQATGVSADMTSFYSDIQSWSKTGRTAAEARTKAYNIRKEAEALRSQAQELTAEEREALLQKADEMENYSTRISATRGNKSKLKALKRDADNKLENK